MRLFRNDHVFKHDWNTVVSAFWLKYPNPLQPHVMRIDTIDRFIDTEQQQYKALRLMSLHYGIPAWIQTIMGVPSSGYGLEETTCNLKTKTLTLKSKNLTFSTFFELEETCEYRPHPECPEHWTMYTQTAAYKIKGLGYLSNVLENAVVQAAGEKAKKGLEAMHGVIYRLESTEWKKTYDETIVSLEQIWNEQKEKVGRTVMEAKHRMEETVLRHHPLQEQKEKVEEKRRE